MARQYRVMQSTTFRSAMLVAPLFGCLISDSSAASPDLAYQFKAGSNHVYSLHLEADEPRQIATLDGLLTLAGAGAGTKRREDPFILL